MPGNRESAQVRFRADPQVEEYSQDRPVRAPGGERGDRSRSPVRGDPPGPARGKASEKKGKDKGKNNQKGKGGKSGKAKGKGKGRK